MRVQTQVSRSLRESRYNIWETYAGDHFVFNGVSGGLLRVSPEQRDAVMRFVAGDEVADVDPSLLLKLVQGRMLVQPDLDELALLRQRYEASRDATSHLGLTIVTSLGCNFACPYCFEDKPTARLQPRVADAIVALVESRAERLTSLQVTWFGGEPLIARRELYRLSERLRAVCEEHDVEYGADVITNGSLLDEATCHELSAQGVTTIQVGLDGPRDVHDCYRPLKGGGSTFDTVLANLIRAVDYFDVSVRINVDQQNVRSARLVLDVLEEAGLAGRVRAYLGHLVALTTNPDAPSASYGHDRCLPMADYAREVDEFESLAYARGFGAPSVPRPTGAPCTAVRKGEWVIGPRGDLWKCWDSVGDPRQVLGNVLEIERAEAVVDDSPWLRYDPFDDPECTRCIALPVCMGGCAHHALEDGQRDNRCGTFRFNHKKEIREFIAAQQAATRMKPLPVLQ
jgi:uncharacterized protein